MVILIKFLRWGLAKFAGAVLIVTLGLAGWGTWLFLKDNVDFAEWRADLVRTLNGDRAHVQSALDDVHGRLDRLAAEISAEEANVKVTEKIIARLTAAESLWERFFGDREQQITNDANRRRMKQRSEAAVAKISTLKTELKRATWERDGLEVALGKLDGRLIAAKAKQSKVMHYFEEVWARARWWVLAVLALYFVGPSVGKLILFYLVAPMIMRGRPVRLEAAMGALPQIAASHVSADLALWPGERLWVREKFLQASDEGLARETRMFLDPKIPFTCAAAGLIELIEMRHRGTTTEGELRLTLSNQNDPHSELAIVTLAEGASLVLRPSFLAGAVMAEGRRLVIRRRWQLFRWQSWVTLQFRFFEFAGPCRLVIAGSRGVRAEWLAGREGNARPARRANQDAVIGFTPNLDYRPVRAETFWSYYRGKNPLFDDLFAGPGMFLCQQISADGDARKARRFWAGVWSGVLKIFGL